MLITLDLQEILTKYCSPKSKKRNLSTIIMQIVKINPLAKFQLMNKLDGLKVEHVLISFSAESTIHSIYRRLIN